MFNKNTSSLTYKDINELLYLKQEGEGQRLDYKRELHKDGKEFAKDVTAFANADGGYIILGIDEKSKVVVGVSDKIGNLKIEDWIENVLNANVSETIVYEIKCIPVSFEEEVPLYAVVIFIPESINKPVYVIADQKTICYIRKGGSVFYAKPDDIKKMYEKKTAIAVQPEINIRQKSKGNNSIQIGINQGTIIKTQKVTKKNEVVTNPEIHISQEQAKQILDKINEIVEINEKAGLFKSTKDKGIFFSQTWTSLKNKFNVTSYHLLPKERFDEVMTWLKKQIAYEHRPKMRKGNNQEWKKSIYTAIYAKAQKELGMDKEGIYQIAYEHLNLKQPISSLKELSDTRLNKLYKFIISR